MNATPKQIKAARQQIAAITRPTFFDSIPIAQLVDALESNGIALDAEHVPFIVCGAEGRFTVPALNAQVMLVASYPCMESGRYEVVAYLS